MGFFDEYHAHRHTLNSPRGNVISRTDYGRLVALFVSLCTLEFAVGWNNGPGKPQDVPAGTVNHTVLRTTNPMVYVENKKTVSCYAC